MSRFSIRNPYFIIVLCLALMVIGVTSIKRMPVDLFPAINLPEVVVATFYSGMPPEDIDTDITNPLERFFTMASGRAATIFPHGAILRGRQPFDPQSGGLEKHSAARPQTHPTHHARFRGESRECANAH